MLLINATPLNSVILLLWTFPRPTDQWMLWVDPRWTPGAHLTAYVHSCLEIFCQLSHLLEVEKQWLEQKTQKKEKKHALSGHPVTFLELFNHGGWHLRDCIKCRALC